jgi:succinylglutamic semialdehyde dehydrogenase
MHSHCINGVWISGAGPSLAVINPATGAHLWRVAQATAAEVEAACSAARAAFAGWSMTPLEDRIKIIRRFRDLLKSDADELVGLISQEVGKPLWEARTEVASMAAKVDISVKAHAVRTGTTVAKVADGDAVVRHRPHGVLGVFGPYNFPGHLPNGHIVPALIAGNTLVFKPSEFAPRTAV